MATTVVLLLIVLHLLLATAAAAAQRKLPVARPGCRDRCGNITVPYPFGIGAGCYCDEAGPNSLRFELECDDGRSPPRLMDPQNNQLADLSLADGEARAYLNATRKCYNSTGGIIGQNTNKAYLMVSGTPFLFSSTKNRLVALGCPNLGFFVDDVGYYVSGCMSVCRPSQEALPGPCTGVGCCQSEIPPGLNFYETTIRNFPLGGQDYTFYANSTPCRYVFLVDKEWFSYSDRVFLNRTDDFDVPVVLDWAVRNVGNCRAAKRNATDFACRSKLSECFDVANGPGYRCNCSRGYDGNPYLDGGCIDIDECKLNGEYPCYGVCKNTQGGHTCQCPPGTTGDATRKDGCRQKDKFTLALKVVTGVSVGVFLSVFMCFWLYLGLQKRKLIKAKQSFFEHNGGVILQQQMRSYSGAAGGGGGGFKIFSEEELKKATNNFAADQILGRGGHGIVYRGVLEDKTTVAIKKSKMMEATETKEFAREMLILSQINHRNVVKLHGCCLEVEVPMLVYEYVSNGTLPLHPWRRGPQHQQGTRYPPSDSGGVCRGAVVYALVSLTPDPPR